MFVRRRACALLPIIALLAATAPAFGAEPASQVPDALMQLIFRMASDFAAGRTREERVSLATHVPGLFGFRFVCLWRPEAGEAVAVIPGDTVEAAGKGKLVCPDGIEVTVEDKGRLHVRQLGPLPEFRLEAGSIAVQFGRVRLGLEAAGMEFVVEGKSVLQHLLVRPQKEATMVLCERGSLTGELTISEGGEKNYLASRACRMEVSGSPAGTAAQVLPGEVVQVLNRAIPRGFRPNESALLGEKVPPPIALWPAEGNSPQLQFTMLTLGPGRKAECTLMVEPAAGQPAREVKTFTVELNQGTIPLESREKGQGYFLVCHDETGAWASSMATIP